MQLLAIISDEAHAAALREARRLGNERPLPAYAPNALDGEVTNSINRIWDEVEGALRRSYREGIQAARPMIDRVSSSIADLATQTGTHAEQVRTVIGERLNIYLQLSIDGALERVRPTMRVGGRELSMVRVSVQQKISLSGSLKTALQEICAFASSGEISLSAEYAFVQDSALSEASAA